MTVCANRTDDPGFFRSCSEANHKACVCGAQVAAELAEQAKAEKERERAQAHHEWLISGGGAA